MGGAIVCVSLVLQIWMPYQRYACAALTDGVAPCLRRCDSSTGLTSDECGQPAKLRKTLGFLPCVARRRK
jgi:hypothetical protein